MQPCYYCGKQAFLCLSNWPDDIQICVCKDHSGPEYVTALRHAIHARQAALFSVENFLKNTHEFGS